MALSYAHGTIDMISTDGVGTTYTVSGLSFQPKAIKVVGYGYTSAGGVDVVSTANSKRYGIGFGTSTSDRRCVAVNSSNAVGTMTCSSQWSDTAIYQKISSTVLLISTDINAINSDGFQLINDTYSASEATTLFWQAWGGDDVSVATTFALTEPAGTGAANYTVTGFVANSTDQVVMLAGVQSTATSGTFIRSDSALMLGYATSTATTNNIVVVGQNDDASTTADCDGYCMTKECLAMLTVGGGNPNAEAILDAWGTNQFTLNWTARGVTGRNYVGLAIKGGNWQAGAYTINGNVASTTAVVSGLGYQPKGVSLISRMTAVQTTGVSTVQDLFSFGCGTTSSQRSLGLWDLDTPTTSEIFTTVQYDQCLAFNSTGAGGTLRTAYLLDAISTQGFTVLVSTAGGVASEWGGYLTFGNGSTAAAAVNAVRPRQLIMTSVGI